MFPPPQGQGVKGEQVTNIPKHRERVPQKKGPTKGRKNAWWVGKAYSLHSPSQPCFLYRGVQRAASVITWERV